METELVPMVVTFEPENYQLAEDVIGDTEHGDRVVIPAGTVLKLSKVVEYRVPEQPHEGSV